MLLSAVSVLVVAQSSSEIPEGLMNNPVYQSKHNSLLHKIVVFCVINCCVLTDIFVLCKY